MARKKKDKLVYYLLAVFVLLALILLYQHFSKPLDVREFDIFFMVSDNGIGFDLNTSLLTFGEVVRGGRAIRNVEFENTYPFPLEIRTLVSPHLAPLILVNDTFRIEPNDVIAIPVTLTVPFTFEPGNYSGTIRFEMYKAD